MRLRRFGGRGRPRGKHRSTTDGRLLQYLALISRKYGVEADEFFSSFVAAWERRQSTCQGLLIECRTQTRESAVFLITARDRVVAQFPIPTHILQEPNPLTGVAYVGSRVPRSTLLEKAEGNPLQIGSLRSGMTGINLKAKVLEIPKPRPIVTRFGSSVTVANASIADDTGTIQLPLWNKQIETVSVGDLIQVQNARVVTFRGERQLRIGRGGHLDVVEKMAHPSGRPLKGMETARTPNRQTGHLYATCEG